MFSFIITTDSGIADYAAVRDGGPHDALLSYGFTNHGHRYVFFPGEGRYIL